MSTEAVSSGYQTMEPLDIAVTKCVLLHLGAWNGKQDRVVAARVVKLRDYDAWDTTSVCLSAKLNHYHFRLVKDETIRPQYLFALLPGSKDVEELHVHCWAWWEEKVLFRWVNEFSIAEFN